MIVRGLRRFLLSARMSLLMAIRALGHRPARTVLTLLGVVIGVVALVVMMSLIGALSSSVKAATVPLGAGVFQIQKEPRFGQRGIRWEEVARRPSFTTEHVEVLRSRLELTEEVGGEMWSWGTSFKTETRSTNPVCGLAGADPAFLEANGFELAAGRFLTERDIAAERPVAVIGSDVVKTLFPGGDLEAIGSEVRLSGVTFTVIGTLVERPAVYGAAWRNCVGVVPISIFDRRFGFRSLHVTFQAKDRDRTRAAIDEAVIAVRSLRRLRPGEPNDFEQFDNESSGESLAALSLAVTAAAAGICLIALMVGGVGVMNIMLVSVTERTREIGLRKAIGARPGSILAQFLIEAVVITGLGGALGVVCAAVVVEVLSRALELSAIIPIWTIVLAIGSSAIIGLLAGVYPALRAARLDPIEALRYE
jgi:putative ABC transport system permease protein